jgi:hypothetical protein
MREVRDGIFKEGEIMKIRPKINDLVVYHAGIHDGNRDLYGTVVSSPKGAPHRYIKIEWFAASSGFLMYGDSDSVPVKQVEKLSTVDLVTLRMLGKKIPGEKGE